MKKNKIKYSLYVIVGIFSTALLAQKPIVQSAYTADPAPLVYNGKVFLYTGHDEDNSTWFSMNNWKLYSSSDMVNWTEHRSPLSYKTFSWAEGDAWAAQCIERNGKFFMYCPVIDRETHSPAIGVAVADSPYGPFYDALGKPLAATGFGDIDPSVFLDSDGQAYLYWGNPNCQYVLLNEDMISYKGSIVTIPLTEASFGKRTGDPKRSTLYEEGPWLYKRNKLYYLFWAGGPLPEHLGYSTSSKPSGPWKYGGTLMPAEGGSFTNHPGVIDFAGKTYLFYHNGALPGGGGFTRSVCVREFSFNADGSIPQLKMEQDIVKGLTVLNPYLKNEAETIAWSEGVKTAESDQVGVFATAVKDGSFIKVRDVDFGKIGVSKFTARMATAHNDVKMEIRIDNAGGQLVGTVNIPRTGGNGKWTIQTIDTAALSGVHDLYFVFKGHGVGELAFFDYWMFK
ncbi:glycoside hydrolase family 43 protein [Flavobacterium adhaerens]|uniref:glycoside hydrolase family 43 protein n=1 Tax=Flavobacterium adhaerens TaxID=3149043 RepID=UPI0032B512CB